MGRRAALMVLFMQITLIPFALAQDSLPDSTTRALRYGSQLPGTTFRRLPVDDPLQGVVLIPGVRLTGPDLGITTFTGLRIRGSAAGRSNVYVDGASLRFETLGGGGVGLASSSVDTLAVLTGVAPAYLSDAGGGVISYRTGSGGARWNGALHLETDAPFSNASSVGYNRFEGMVGGPVAMGGKLTLALSASLQGQQASYRAPGAASTPSYLPNGIDTLSLPLPEQSSSGLRWPLDWSTARRGHAKLLYRYGASSKASLIFIGGDLQQRFFPAQFSFVPSVYSGALRSTTAAIVDVQHELGTWRGRPLALGVNLSLVKHRLRSGPLDSTVELATRDPALGIAFDRLHFAGAEIVGLPAHNAMIRGLRSGQAALVVPYFNSRPDLTQSYANPYGILDATWPTEGYGGVLTDVLERRVQGRATLDWRRSSRQYNAIGVDFERSNVSSYTSDIVRQIGTNVFTAEPARFGLFSDNRFDWGGAILDLGLRFDRFNPGGDLPNTPAYISSSDPNFWNPASATDDTAYANSVSRVFHPASTKTAFSPRIRFEYPLSTRTSVHLGYSRNVEPPTWSTFFAHSNSDLSFTNLSSTVFGQDVDFAMSGLVEGGVRYGHGSVVVDLSAYRKDVPGYVGRFTPFTNPNDSSSQITILELQTLNTGHAWGTDLGVDWRRGWVTTSAAYSYAHISSSPEGAVAGSTTPMNTHSGALALALQIPRDWKQGSWLGPLLGETEIVVWGRLQSGATIAPAFTTGTGTVTAPQDLTLPVINGDHLPAFKRLDLRFSKVLRAAGQRWSLYVDARNLLNFQNLISVFAETGDTANSTHRQLTIGNPATPSGAYALIRNFAANESALESDGTTVNLGGCATWSSQVNCLAWNRVEQRYGNGDQLFTLAEQQQAFELYYRDYFGGWRFYDPGRTVRIGVEFAP